MPQDAREPVIPVPVRWALLAGLAFRAWKGLSDPDLAAAPLVVDYRILGQSLARHGVLGYDGVHPSAFRLPLWPLTLAAVFLAFGPDAVWGVRALNLAFAAASTVLTYHLARRLLPRGWASAAAWAFVLNPTLVNLDYSEGYEPLLTLLFVVLALALVRAVEEPESWRPWLAGGLSTGLSLACRSSLLFVPPAAAVLVPRWAVRPGAWRRGLAMTALAYAFVVPWLARNYALFGRVIPFEDGMGLHAFYQGTASVQGIMPDSALPEPIRTYYFSHDPRIGPASKEAALANIKADPARYAGYCARRLRTLWLDWAWADNAFHLLEPFSEYRRRGDWLRAGTRVAMKGAELAFILGAVWGAAALWPDPRSRPLPALLLYMNIHVLTQGLARYMAPTAPVLCVLCLAGLRDASERLRRAVEGRA